MVKTPCNSKGGKSPTKRKEARAESAETSPLPWHSPPISPSHSPNSHPRWSSSGLSGRAKHPLPDSVSLRPWLRTGNGYQHDLHSQ